MIYQLSPGHRVTWCHDFTETKAQITRVWKHQAEILTTDFQKLKVPLDELELVPVVISISPRDIEMTEDKPISISPRAIEMASGTIGTYRKGNSTYWRYSYRQGRKKMIHKHIGKVGTYRADCLVDEVKTLIAAHWPIEEILRIL